MPITLLTILALILIGILSYNAYKLRQPAPQYYHLQLTGITTKPSEPTIIYYHTAQIDPNQIKKIKEHIQKFSEIENKHHFHIYEFESNLSQSFIDHHSDCIDYESLGDFFNSLINDNQLELKE